MCGGPWPVCSTYQNCPGPQHVALAQQIWQWKQLQQFLHPSNGSAVHGNLCALWRSIEKQESLKIISFPGAPNPPWPFDRCFAEESFGRCSPLMFCDKCRPHVGSWDQQDLAVMVHYFKQELNFVTTASLSSGASLVMSSNQVLYIISCSEEVQPSYCSLMRLVFHISKHWEEIRNQPLTLWTFYPPFSSLPQSWVWTSQNCGLYLPPDVQCPELTGSWKKI